MLNEVLKQARLSAGISQKNVAEKLKLTRPIYNQIEQGKILPRYEDLEKLSQILKLDITKLQQHMCIHQKTKCIHPPKPKTRLDTYKLSVSLRREDFTKLTKENLKKCGYKNLTEFVSMAYKQLEKQLKQIENKK